jgi:hypothetical protein
MVRIRKISDFNLDKARLFILNKMFFNGLKCNTKFTIIYVCYAFVIFQSLQADVLLITKNFRKYKNKVTILASSLSVVKLSRRN